MLLELRRENGETSPICRRTLLCAYLRRMEDAVDALVRDGLEGLMDEYLRRSVTLGARVRVTLSLIHI